MGKPEPLYKRRPRLVGAIGGALGLTLVVILAVGICNLRFGFRINGVAVMAATVVIGAALGGSFPKFGRVCFYFLEGLF